MDLALTVLPRVDSIDEEASVGGMAQSHPHSQIGYRRPCPGEAGVPGSWARRPRPLQCLPREWEVWVLGGSVYGDDEIVSLSHPGS